jgi:1-acyl-sn-glycerol-3-phosphate acyltransferase
VKVQHGISFLKGIPPLLYIVINLCFWLAPLIPLSLLKMIIPINRVQDTISSLMAWIYNLAVWCDDFLFLRIMGIKLAVEGIKEQYPKKFYIIIANHQSWNDIFILQHLFNWRTPVLKFLVKRELIYLPLVGLICWAYGYPFLKRRSLKGRTRNGSQRHGDVVVLEKALDRFIRYPATVINLVEGTRFSPAKARGQKSPYEYLLKPRAGGLTTMLDLLGNRVEVILDVTIIYDCEDPTFWNFLCGQCRRVFIKVKEHSPDEISPARDFETVATWIDGIWKEKDLKIRAARQELGMD